MVDLETRDRLTVLDEYPPIPHIRLLVEQVEAVAAVLGAHGVRYWLDPVEISINGRRAFTHLNLGRGTRAADVQRLLDAVD